MSRRYVAHKHLHWKTLCRAYDLPKLYSNAALHGFRPPEGKQSLASTKLCPYMNYIVDTDILLQTEWHTSWQPLRHPRDQVQILNTLQAFVKAAFAQLSSSTCMTEDTKANTALHKPSNPDVKV